MDIKNYSTAKWPSHSSAKALVRMEGELITSGVCDELYLDELYESLWQRSLSPDQDYYDCLVSMINKNLDKLNKLWEEQNEDN